MNTDIRPDILQSLNAALSYTKLCIESVPLDPTFALYRDAELLRHAALGDSGQSLL